MPDLFTLTGALLVGFMLGLGPALLLLKSRSEAARQSGRQEGAAEIGILLERLASREELLQQRDAAIRQQSLQIEQLAAGRTELEREKATLHTRLQEELRRSEDKLNVLHDARQDLQSQFKQLANQIFDEKTRAFTDQSRANLDTILAPFKERIVDFEKMVTAAYSNEGKERHSLIREVQKLQELNQRISEDAENLTKALKGDSKTQGAWGEIILERILEESGLRKGIEYDSQGGFRDSEGKLLKPDVIVHLPEGKDIIIDSKVSLTAYEKYSRAETDEERHQTVKAHLLSINSHLKGLESKRYDTLPGVNSLDFVLLFIPVESAFMLTVEKDNEIFRKAFEKNIMIVSPSTLLVTLRTIQNIWRYEYQSKNAQEIAEKAGSLYDKFVGFVADLERVGDQLGNVQKSYDSAHNKLVSGRGSLVSRAQNLISLGVKSRKSLPASVRQATETDPHHIAQEPTETDLDN